MKAITVKQPWASLICTPRKENPAKGIKDIENRTWKCPSKYIGKRVLIHAGLNDELMNIPPSTFMTGDQIDAMDKSKIKFDQKEWDLYGVIIGSVEIVDCVINHQSIWADETKKFHQPIYNWVLANPILFPEPIPAKGKLSFWEFELP